MTQTLKQQGWVVNRKRVQRLMRLMDLESVAPKPNTSKPAPENPAYPYLLRNLAISRGQSGLRSGHHIHSDGARFCYLVATVSLTLVAIIDWAFAPRLGLAVVQHVVFVTFSCAKKSGS